MLAGTAGQPAIWTEGVDHTRQNALNPPLHSQNPTKQQTEKGYGYAPAEAASDKYHGVAKFDVSTGRQFKGGAKGACTCLLDGVVNSSVTCPPIY